MRLKGKVCAISGGGNGIGEAAAKLFAAEGAMAVILERNEMAGRRVEADIRQASGEARFIRVDVSDAESVREAFESIRRDHGRLDCLYNNASIFLGGRDAPVVDLDLDVWRTIIDVNLNGLFHCCKFGISLIIDSGGGSVINTSSSAGGIGIPGCDAYSASKGATVSLTRSMAVEYGPMKVRVNCVAPAAIMTDMVRQSNLDDDTFDERAFLDLRSPLRRYGTPEEVARLALFLASDESSYLNGAIITVDGGITINGDLSKH